MKFDFKIVNLFLAGILGLMFVFQVFLNLSVIDLNYKIKELKANLEGLSLQNKTLNFKYLQEKEKYFATLGTHLVKSDKIEFVTIRKGISLLGNSFKSE